MASLIPGFEYDIFVSYRQKDNKGDRWVSEFVESLKTELESTFKEDVSVYFDINPHNGLLETHDVNASLKEKLRCLIFIPIISRTYCDPNSFAWEHELKPFVERATKDQFGLRINLPNGNVASRVLPVRIHDLTNSDIKLCETVLGGVLRGVDFVYRSPGVNRPLRQNEDNPQDNLNKTYYRDQINKVSNAIDEILQGLMNQGTIKENEGNLSESTENVINNIPGRMKPGLNDFLSRYSRKIFIFLLLSVMFAVGAWYVYNLLSRGENKKSLAILPFRCPGNDPEQISTGDIFTEVALIKLHNIKSLVLRSRISTNQYRDTKKSLNTIRKELDVSYIVEGSIRREGGKTIIWIGLTDAKNNKQLWSNEYVWENNHISGIVSEITRNIATGCNAKLSSEELKLIESNPTNNNNAYLKYLSANVISSDAWNLAFTGNILTDSAGFKKAIREYDNAIKYDSLFAEAYARRAIARAWGYYIGQFDTTSIKLCWMDIGKALKINKDLTDAQIALGFYYNYCEPDYQKALVHFNRAAAKDPENYQPLFYLAMVYRRMGDWGKSQSLISMVIRQNPQVALFLTNIGTSYTYLHKFDSALIYQQKAIDIMPQWRSPYVNKIAALILKEGSTSEARNVLDAATRSTGDDFHDLRGSLDIYDGKLRNALNETDLIVTRDLKSNGEKYLTYAKIYHLMNNQKYSRIYYDSALISLNSINNAEKDAKVHSLVGIALAGKGIKDKAVEEGQLAVDNAVRNKMDESQMKINQTIIYVMVNDYEDAIINIEYLLENPSLFSIKYLQLDPVWKPLLNTQEIRNLIKKYSEQQ